MDNKKIGVLIVDDDKTLCKMLEDMLSKEEYLKVTSTNDGHDAIQKVKENKLMLDAYNKSMAVAIDKAMRGSDAEDMYFMEKLRKTAGLLGYKLVKE